MDCGRKWLFHFSVGRTQLVLFDWANTDAFDVKMDESFLEEK